MNDIIAGGNGFVAEKIDNWTTVYRGNVNGHFVEIVEVNYKGTDYSMSVDCNDVFNGWRRWDAMPKIRETLKGLCHAS